MMDHTAGIFLIFFHPSQVHPSPITLWQVILIFMLFVLSAVDLCLSCLIHKNVTHFDSLILPNTFLCNFLLVFCLQHLHSQDKMGQAKQDKFVFAFSNQVFYFLSTIKYSIFLISFNVQIFLSSQVKRWTTITYKHGIYELPHELTI